MENDSDSDEMYEPSEHGSCSSSEELESNSLGDVSYAKLVL